MPLLVLEQNFNDTRWLSTDRLRIISPLCLPGLGTGINAAVILTAAVIATLKKFFFFLVCFFCLFVVVVVFVFFCLIGHKCVNLIGQNRSVSFG